MNSINAYRTIPNAMFKPKREKNVFVADQVSEVVDCISLLHKRPIERGFLVNFEAEKEIWERVVGKKNLDINPAETHLVLTEPVFNFEQIQKKTDELVFETFHFLSLVRATGIGFSIFFAIYSSIFCILDKSRFDS